MPLALEQLKNPETISKIDTATRELIEHPETKDAYFLIQDIQPNLPQIKNDMDLYKKYLALLVRLKAIALPMLKEDEVVELFKNYLSFLFRSNINVASKLTAKMYSLPLMPRDQLRQRLQATVRANTEKIGPSSVNALISEYDDFADPRERTSMSSTEFVFRNEKLNSLSENEKSALQKLLSLYDNFLLITPTIPEPLLSELIMRVSLQAKQTTSETPLKDQPGLSNQPSPPAPPLQEPTPKKSALPSTPPVPRDRYLEREEERKPGPRIPRPPAPPSPSQRKDSPQEGDRLHTETQIPSTPPPAPSSSDEGRVSVHPTPPPSPKRSETPPAPPPMQEIPKQVRDDRMGVAPPNLPTNDSYELDSRLRPPRLSETGGNDNVVKPPKPSYPEFQKSSSPSLEPIPEPEPRAPKPPPPPPKPQNQNGNIVNLKNVNNRFYTDE